MPPVINNSGCKAGSIYRVKLVNFVTYKKVEFFPGSSLNMIIGPNGTGKSTFVCALILGLGGNIASIGRSKQLSDYIRTGCSEATIEIELYQQRGEPNVKITRIIKSTGTRSEWYINTTAVPHQKVMDLIKSFHIQVDNLCQMLPQDRVKEFSAMSPQILLEKTLEAIGEQEKVNELNELKKWRTKQCSLTAEIQKNEKEREALMKENDVLRANIDTYNRLKDMDHEIEVCSYKILCLEAEALEKDVERLKQDQNAAQAVLQSSKEQIQPLQDTLKEIDREKKTLENDKLSLNGQINNARDKIDNIVYKVNVQKRAIETARSYYEHHKEKRDKERQMLVDMTAKLQQLQGSLDNARVEYGDVNSIDSELKTLRTQLINLDRNKFRLQEEKTAIEDEFERNVFPEIALCRTRLQSLQSEQGRRLAALRGCSQDSHRALLWLRDHRQLFAGAVCEPIMLELTFRDQRDAKFVEATVPRRDLLAFTFESVEDMNLFLIKTRKEQGLSQVNAVHSPPEPSSFPSPDIDRIRQFGFSRYVSDTYSAPAPVARYLCRAHGVHRIPLGDARTYNSMERVPADIRLFFTDRQRVSVKVSRYSGERIVSLDAVSEARLLAGAPAATLQSIEHTTARLAELEVEKQTYEKQKQDLKSQLDALARQAQPIEERQTKLRSHIRLINELSTKISRQQTEIERLRNGPSTDLVRERQTMLVKQREAAVKQRGLHEELLQLAAAIHQLVPRDRLLAIALQRKLNSEAELKNQYNELNEKVVENERAARAATEALSAARRAAAQAREAERRARSGLRDYRALYGELPARRPALLAHRADLRARRDCIADGDYDADLETFERNVQQIQALAAMEVSGKQQLTTLDSSMATIKESWVRFVRQLVEEVSGQFRRMFQRLGYSGEVCLRHGASEDEFSSYGVYILVQFGASDTLAALTSRQQSGGQRAVSTAVYLFALQRRTSVPFRCVDEINQGMDARHERMIFNFLVDVTTDGERGQYFLLTPKLLPNLGYNENVTVHTVMNGRGAGAVWPPADLAALRRYALRT